MNGDFDLIPGMGESGPPWTGPTVADEVDRWTQARPLLAGVAEAARAGFDGDVGLPDTVLRIGAVMGLLYSLATGLEDSTDPSFEALAHRVESWAHALMSFGDRPIDKTLRQELEMWPEALRLELVRALSVRGEL